MTETDYKEYTFKIPNLVLKYISSNLYNTAVEVKDFDMCVELNSLLQQVDITVKYKDLYLALDNADEMIFFFQKLSNKYKEIYIDIEENKKVILEIKVLKCFSMKKMVEKVLEKMDLILIAATHLATILLKFFYYQRTIKDAGKFDFYSSWIKFHGEIYKPFFIDPHFKKEFESKMEKKESI